MNSQASFQECNLANRFQQLSGCLNVSIPTADGESIAERITIEIPMEWNEEIHDRLLENSREA